MYKIFFTRKQIDTYADTYGKVQHYLQMLESNRQKIRNSKYNGVSGECIFSVTALAMGTAKNAFGYPSNQWNDFVNTLFFNHLNQDGTINEDSGIAYHRDSYFGKNIETDEDLINYQDYITYDSNGDRFRMNEQAFTTLYQQTYYSNSTNIEGDHTEWPIIEGNIAERWLNHTITDNDQPLEVGMYTANTLNAIPNATGYEYEQMQGTNNPI